MPNINEFLGPKPEEVYKAELEKVIGNKPCSKCEADVHEAFWNPLDLIMTWTCPNGHLNTFKVN
jgi:hypothetical protein